MAVYQSGTAPIIRKRTYTELVPYDWFYHMSEAGVARYMRKRNQIPRKAAMFVEVDPLSPGHHTFRFVWFEVETNA